MNSLLVSAVFPPEPLVSGRTSADLAAALQSRGHDVTVLAPYPSRPGGLRYPGYPRRGDTAERTVEGYGIIRCNSAHSNESKLASRLWENLTFGLRSAWRVLWMKPRPNVIYANTWPLVAAGLLALVASLRGIPLVLSVQDLYPESLAAQGRIKSKGLLYRVLQRWDGWIARRSLAVVVIGESFVQVYCRQRHVAPERVHVVPNWVDDGRLSEEFERLSGIENPIRKNLGLTDSSFLMVYAGNIGTAAGVENLLRAMSELREDTDIHLLVAGSGTRLPACQLLAQVLDLRRVHFLSPWEESETALVLSAADLLLLPTQGMQSYASVPSKVAYYLLSGRPLLVIAQEGTDLAKIVEDSGCGWLTESANPAILANLMRQVHRMSAQQREAHGIDGRSYSLSMFTRQAGISALTMIVEGAVLNLRNRNRA